MKILHLIGISIGLSLFGPLPAYPDERLPAPPYLIAGTHHILLGVVWDEAAIRKVLPSWIKPAAEMTGLINIYQAPNGYGITPYHAAYFSIDVQGFDSADGVKGRWIMQGVYGPQEKASAALKEWYGLPVRTGTSRFEKTAEGLRGVGTVDGHDFVTVEIRSFPDQCESSPVTLNYPTPKGLIEIPVAGESCRAEPISVTVTAQPGDPFAAFHPIKVLWAVEYKNGAFSITRPLPIDH